MSYQWVSRAVAAGLIVAAQTGLAAATELKVLTTPALTEVWHDLAPKFEATGHKLTIVYAPSGAVAKRVLEGETADLLVTTPAGIDVLIKEARVIPGTNISIASSCMVVAVLKGASKPDISTPEAFRRALLAARAVAYSDPTSGGSGGAHFMKVLERLGIASDILAKGKSGRATPVATFVVKGEADIAVLHMHELTGVEGIDIVGPLPVELQSVIVFAAGIPSSSTHAVEARELIRFLQTPGAAATIKRYGLDPVAPPTPPKGS